MKIRSPILVATLTVGAAALALATRKPAEPATVDDRPGETQTQHGPWFI